MPPLGHKYTLALAHKCYVCAEVESLSHLHLDTVIENIVSPVFVSHEVGIIVNCTNLHDMVKMAAQ